MAGIGVWRRVRVTNDRHTHGLELVAGGVLALVAVLAQGYLGGRMTYHHGGCAYCHGDRAQGMRGPQLAGGIDIADFRRVHAHGLFPPAAVPDKDFAAIDAWLKTLHRSGGRG